jgi:hypothetical protein
MMHLTATDVRGKDVVISELILSDRLIALAEDADHAGYTATAERLLKLACSVFDEAPGHPH